DLPAYQEALVTRSAALGRAQLAGMDLAKAEASFTLMQEGGERFLRRAPDSVKYQRLEAEARTEPATAHRYRGRFAEAEKKYREALPALERLGDRPSRVALGMLHNHLGVLYHRWGRPAEAERHHRRALAVREALVKAHGSVPSYRAYLASS